MNRDQLTNASASHSAVLAMRLIDNLQTRADATKAEVLTAVAMTFLALSEETGIEAQDVFTTVKNMIANSQRQAPEFKTIRDYIRAMTETG